MVNREKRYQLRQNRHREMTSGHNGDALRWLEKSLDEGKDCRWPEMREDNA